MFAGARALLVSHWSVEDRATRELMTRVFEHYARLTSKSEALRRGMLDVMGRGVDGTSYLAHPFSWAAFSLVGGG